MANYHLRARDIMQTDLATILPEHTVQDAAALMRHHGVRSLIVEQESGGDDAYGIITYADIVDKVLAYGFNPAEMRVDEIMTKPVIMLNPAMKVEMIARLFANSNIGHAPVIEADKIIGMVSMTDLITEVITEPE